MPTRKRHAQVLISTAVLALVATGCGPFGGGEDDGARTAADVLARALAAGDVAKVGFVEPDAVATYTKLWQPLKGGKTTVAVEQVAVADKDATATLDWDVEIDGAHWKHSTEVTLAKAGGVWRPQWQPSILESSLEGGETLVVTGIKAARGNIVGAGDQALVKPRAVTRFGIDKALAAAEFPGADLADSARRLAVLLDVDTAALVKAVDKAGRKAFVSALVLREADVTQSMLAGVANIPGARSIADRLPLAPSKDFAAALLGTVGPATAEIIKDSKGRLKVGDDAGLSGLQARYDVQLSGTPGVIVSAALPEAKAGEPKTDRVLFRAEPKNGEPLTLTMDRRLQSKAQQLLNRYGPASALVAIKPSTGEILAAASGPGSKGYNTATFGQYAPGSTFKVVSSLALLRAGLKPDSTVSCPATETVNGKQFKNYSDYPSNRLGRITLRQAVANSCNTAFISSRTKIKGSALADAAAALGFGVDHDLGFPAYFGQVPASQGETEAAADLIGQGKILASPMAMAAVAASVVHGSTVVPDLISGDQASAGKVAKPLTEAEAASLRTLMRAVVEEGSGAFLQALGSPPVLAKTGTAEYGSATGGSLPTHTWMIGAQGDLAVAVFVADGESGSRTAGPVLADFLRAAR